MVIDLVVASSIGAALVYAAWGGFMRTRTKARTVVVALGIVNLAAAEFAYSYWSVSQQNTTAFTEPLDRAGAANLSVATFTTVDVGELAPISSGARLVAAGQMGFGVIALVVGLASIVGAASRR